MNHCYRHLSAEDRAAIMMMRATHSIRAIAHHLGRALSTVSREIARHSINGYDASLAGYRARLTARTLKRMSPNDSRRQVSHEAIYNALYVMPRGSLKKELIACLRQGNGKRRL